MAEEKEVRDSQKKSLRLNILASVIASVAMVYLIQPILNFLWTTSLGLGTHALEFFTNRLYFNAAMGERNWIVSMLAIMFFLAPLIGSSTFLLMSIFERTILFRGIEDKNDKTSRKIRIARLRAVLYIALGIASFFGFSLSASIYYDIQLNTSFKQRLTVLSPALTDVEEKEYRAKWAKMKSRSDYEQINSMMEANAARHSIHLPELLLK
jgi:hypothetical protein